MKYKKILLGSSLLASVSVAGFAHADDAYTDSVIINFTGAFQDSTCSIDIGGDTDKNIIVPLGVHSLTELTADQAATSPVDFTAKFSGCGGLTSAQVTFNGTQTTSGLFDVTGLNKGKVGVGINKAKAVGDYIKNGIPDAMTITGDTAELTFYARYVKIGTGELVASQEPSAATMDITYQ